VRAVSGGPAFPCARCGRPIRRVTRPTRRELACPRCRYLIYDYPRACAGVIVHRGADLLVLRRAHRPKRGWLDLPGGFVEADESLESAARRELLEETGLRVGALSWLGFYWDRYYLAGFGRFPTMNFYWLARWKSGTPRAADDAASAEWLPLATLGRPGARLAWTHMRDVLRDVRRRLRP
jgi:8-oxo-dGTP diphosphatase